MVLFLLSEKLSQIDAIDINNILYIEIEKSISFLTREFENFIQFEIGFRISNRIFN
jgi:hypothetical protein